jgi:hypothetical protein
MTMSEKFTAAFLADEAATRAHEELMRTLDRQAAPLRATLEALQESPAQRRLAEAIAREQDLLRTAMAGPGRELERLTRAVHDQAAPLRTALEAFRETTALRHLTESIAGEQTWLRTALGPARELGLAGITGSVLDPVTEQMRQALASFQANFQMPGITEAKRLLAEAEASGAFSAMEHYQQQAADIRRAMEAMHTPWLDVQDKILSVAGFAELQGIGLALTQFHAFDDRLADSLRVDLGDWRGAITWPDGIFVDPLARTDFYADRGLDLRLTRFPNEAFEQGISIAGLRDAPPPIVDQYDGQVGGKSHEEEAGFARTNDAHDRLQRFETQLRRFIDKMMTAACGESWTKQRVPGEIRKNWLEKRQKARDNGEPERPLIAYADFTDYVQIITRRDNWDEIFKPAFRRTESVQESFQRLYPIRVCTMHARIITQDDQLYLYAETTRMLAAIKVTS